MGPYAHSYYGGIPLFFNICGWFSQYTWLYLLQNWSKLPKIYSEFQKMVHTQFSCNIKIFRSNNAIEYRESTFLTTLKQIDIFPHHSCSDTSQQNGRAKHKHIHILDTIWVLLNFCFYSWTPIYVNFISSSVMLEFI